MVDLIHLFIDNIMPVILIAGLGYLLQRIMNVNPRELSQVVFYLFIPALLFVIFLTTDIPITEMMQMVTFAIVVMICIGAISWIFGRSLNLETSLISALIITSTFMNSGNFGLSVTQFAFGNQGLVWAGVFYVTSSMLNNSVGVYVAAIGKSSAKSAIFNLLKVPAVYAIPLALLVRNSGTEISQLVLPSVELLGRAAIPSMLLLLGMQTAKIKLFPQKKILFVSIALRLIFSPLIAWLISPIFDLPSVARQVGILEAAMPTAVLNSVIALKYDLEPDFVSSTIIISTLVSLISLTLLLATL